MSAKLNDVGKAIPKKITKKLVLTVVICVGLLVAGVFAWKYTHRANVDVDHLYSALEKASDLITAKLHTKDLVEYEDSGTIPFVTKGGFVIVFDATVTAGINVEDIDISKDVNKKIVTVKLPKAVIKDAYADPDTIKYYDQKFKLLNFTEKEDVTQALSLANKKAKEDAENTGILELADQQSEALIKGLLIDAIPDEYTLEVTHQES